MRSRIAVLGFALGVAASGCGFSSGGGNGGGGVDACVSFASLLDTCQLAFDGDLMIMGMATYDTDTGVLTTDGTETQVAHAMVMIAGDEVDVLFARNVRMSGSGSLRGIGARPLAIVASDTLTVEAAAAIDVSDGGAGAQTTCANGASVGLSDGRGAGGGGGGSYGADGGNGGNGTSAMSGMKGAAVSLPTGLHGGCPGAAGGDGNAPGGAGGAGGGALYVVAAKRIELASLRSITAGGGGGHGGGHNGTGGEAGGGGGGSGGMLILEAPQIMGANTTITANGGGGGEGSDDIGAGNNGDPGSLSTSRADGGSDGANNGADGGRGGSRDTPTGEPGATATSSTGGGGGGGGGGVGFIRIISPDVQGVTTSPNLSP